MTAAASKKAAPPTNGTVVGVVSGDTLLIRFPAAKPKPTKKGKHKPAKSVPPTRVRILGVQAPSGAACYAKESAALVRDLALGKTATLLGDANNGFYVSVPGTDDLGRALIGRGAGQVDPASGAFSRIAAYVPLQQQAEQARQGMWSACSADLSTTMTGPESAFVGQDVKYSVVVSNAGPMVADAVDLQLRPGAYRETLVSASTPSGTCTPTVWMAHCAINGIAPGASATVTVVLRGSDFGALSARAQASLVGCVTVQCTGPLLDPNNDNDAAAAVTILPGGGYVKACDPSYPTVCLPLTPPDLDCADFLPLNNFPVDYSVKNPDPHHLDGNHDGIACQGEDY